MSHKLKRWHTIKAIYKTTNQLLLLIAFTRMIGFSLQLNNFPETE